MKTIIKATILTFGLLLTSNALAMDDLNCGVRDINHKNPHEMNARREISRGLPVCAAPETDSEICACVRRIERELDAIDCHYPLSTGEALYCGAKPKRHKVSKVYTLIVDQESPEALKSCQQDENCMDVLEWKDVTLKPHKYNKDKRNDNGSN